jgi:N-acetylmuramoyl-L-alanine amidase
MIHAKPYDLVISVHHNGGGGDGAEICVQINNGSKTYDDKALKFANLLLAEYKTIGQNLRRSPIIRKANSTGREDYFGVLRAAAGKGIPAVITEYAFMDSKDIAAVDTYADQKLEAQAICAAVKKYFE